MNTTKPAPRMPILGACSCRPGIERDNCPSCEGTGHAIDWRRFHEDRKAQSTTPANTGATTTKGA